jgi:CTP synthase (UTP-ammonia lyase)
LIGDRDDGVTAHRAIPLALQQAAADLHVALHVEWVPTEQIGTEARVARYDGFWCVPASPYRSMDGALGAIRYARERGRPFLGTCGGFQHAAIEYARSVLGWADAEHAETAPDAPRAVIAPLACALVEAQERVQLLPGTRIAAIYGTPEVAAEYRCRYGLNEEFRAALTAGPLCASALGADGEVRAVELAGHPWFIATLFQPERAALRGEPVPLARALVSACAVARGMVQ